MAFSPQLDGKYKISLFESCSPAKTTMKKGTMYKDNLKGKVKDKICLFEQTNKIDIGKNKDHVNAENTVRVKKKVSFFLLCWGHGLQNTAKNAKWNVRSEEKECGTSPCCSVKPSNPVTTTEKQSLMDQLRAREHKQKLSEVNARLRTMLIMYDRSVTAKLQKDEEKGLKRQAERLDASLQMTQPEDMKG